MVVAAGNSRADACSFSPASADLALTVASTEIAAVDSSEEQEDKRSSFSNFGACVDIAAPGSLIKAAWIDKEGIAPNHVYNVISGTSMASPHVAGVAAVLLSAQPELKPADVAARLVADANLGMVDFDCNGNEACEKTPNVLLHTNTCA
jgi:subtilisin family serine protease